MKKEARNKDTRGTKEALNKMRGKRKQEQKVAGRGKQTNKQKIALNNILILIYVAQYGPRLLKICFMCCEDTSPVRHILGRTVLLLTEYFQCYLLIHNFTCSSCPPYVLRVLTVTCGPISQL